MQTDSIQPLLELTRTFRIEKILLLIAVTAALIVVVKIIQRLGEKLQDRFARYRLIILQVVTVISFFLYLVGGGSLFYFIINPPKEVLIAIGGSIAVAVGFSLKDLVGSFVAGIVLLFDRPFQVGDRISFNDVYGEIISIGLRAVRLKTLTDDLVTIPNGKFFTDVVSSANAGALDMMVASDFHISLDADLSKARALLHEVVVTSRFVFLKKPVAIVVAEVEAAGRLTLRLTAKAYVLDVKYEKAFQSDIVTRAAEVFRENKIARPLLLDYA
jgi:small-conductance mechanosensitive channel